MPNTVTRNPAAPPPADNYPRKDLKDGHPAGARGYSDGSQYAPGNSSPSWSSNNWPRQELIPQNESFGQNEAPHALGAAAPGGDAASTNAQNQSGADASGMGVQINWAGGDSIAAYEQRTGVKPASVGGYIPAGNGTLEMLGAQKIIDQAAQTGVPTVVLSVTSGEKGAMSEQELSQFKQLAEDAKSKGVNLQVRFGYEMNLDYISGYNDPAVFKQQWAQVADAVHAGGGTMNWCPSYSTPEDYQKWLPDDPSSIDVVGLDVYHMNAGDIQPGEVKNAISGIESVPGLKGKPLTFPETGVQLAGDGSDAIKVSQWLAQLSDPALKAQFPNYAGFLWFDYNKPGDGNYALSENPEYEKALSQWYSGDGNSTWPTQPTTGHSARSLNQSFDQNAAMRNFVQTYPGGNAGNKSAQNATFDAGDSAGNDTSFYNSSSTASSSSLPSLNFDGPASDAAAGMGVQIDWAGGDSITAYTKRTGVKPKSVGGYIPASHGTLDMASAQRMIQQAGQNGVSTFVLSVTSGEMAAMGPQELSQFKQLAQEAKSQGVNLQVRFGYEMNLSAVSGYTDPALFKQQWAQVADAVHAGGGTMNWCPSYSTPEDYKKWLPDDPSSIDVVGLDVYHMNAGDIQPGEVRNAISGIESVPELSGKPLTFPETGVQLTGDGSDARKVSQWLAQLSDPALKAQYPNFKGFLWFDYNKPGDGNYALSKNSQYEQALKDWNDSQS